jgi:hypothetical protein
MMESEALLKPSSVVWKIAAFICTALTLIAPFVYNIAFYAHWRGGMIAESSVYSLDRAKYFSGFIHGGSLFFAGQHSVFLLNYALWYALWSALGGLFSDITSYMMLVIIFYLLGLCFLVKLLLALVDVDERRATVRQMIVACAIALLYLSSLSMFNYNKSNIFFTLPYLVLPILLYFTLSYLRTSRNRHLVPFFLASLVITDFNTAHAVILVAFINIFALMQGRAERVPLLSTLGRLVILDVVMAPAVGFLFAIAIENALYAGSLAGFSAAVVENMYSNNAQYLNIFAQLTDWGIFGSWNGSLYYDFSRFYSNIAAWGLALVPFMFVGYAALSSRASIAQRKFAFALLITAAVIFQFMLGNNNALYNYVYNHLIAFQVLRNITKLAPLLLLVILVAGYILISGRLKERVHFISAMLFLLVSLAYNIPYWSYSGYFFYNRTIDQIPSYWREAAGYLNDTAQPSSKVLALPAIYINDVYMWNGKENWVQGSLLDILLRNKSYRLSECCLGSPMFERDARSTFIPSKTSIRRLDTDYGRLGNMARKYGLDYVLVSDDLLSEYNTRSAILAWLRRAGYHEARSFGPVSIFHNKRNLEPLFSGMPLSFERISDLEYRVHLRGVKGRRTLAFGEPFHTGWTLSPIPIEAKECGFGNDILVAAPTCKRTLAEKVGDEVRHLSGGPTIPPLDATSGDSNSWVIDESVIEKSAPKSFYRVEPGGGIDVDLDLYFKPQDSFLAICFVSLLAFVTMVACLLIALIVDLRAHRISSASRLRDSSLAWSTALLIVLAATISFTTALAKDRQPLLVETARVDSVLTDVGQSALFSNAMYMPVACGPTSSNSHCQSIRLSSVTKANGNRLWGWDYDERARELTECSLYTSVSAPCSPGAEVMSIGNIDAFVARGERTKTSGALVLSIRSGETVKSVSISSGRRPFEESAVYMKPLLQLGSSVETATPNLVFATAKSPAQRVRFSLANYDQYERFAHPPWSVSACGHPVSTATTRASSFGDGLNVWVTPLKPGTCDLAVIADPTDKVTPIATPAVVRVVVIGDLSWSRAAARAKASVSFDSTIASPQTLQAYKNFDPDAIVLSPLSACSEAVVSDTIPAGLASNQAGIATLYLRPTRSGICEMSLKGNNAVAGEAALALTVHVYGDLSFSTYSPIGSRSLEFDSANAPSAVVHAYKLKYAGPLQLHLVAGNCSSVVGFYAQTSHSAKSVSGEWTQEAVRIQPVKAGKCWAILQDQFGTNDRSIALNVTIKSKPRSSGDRLAHNRVRGSVR